MQRHNDTVNLPRMLNASAIATLLKFSVRITYNYNYTIISRHYQNSKFDVELLGKNCGDAAHLLKNCRLFLNFVEMLCPFG